MVLPLIIKGLSAAVPLFLQAAVTSAGSLVGTKTVEALWPKTEATGNQEVLTPFLKDKPTADDAQKLENYLSAEMIKDPSFQQKVEEALIYDIRQYPEFVDSLTWSFQATLNLSNEHALYFVTHHCPIGGEPLEPNYLTGQRGEPPRYFASDGTEIDFWAVGFKEMPRSTIVICYQGHRWPMFGNKAS